MRYRGTRPEYRYSNESLDQGWSRYFGAIVIAAVLMLIGAFEMLASNTNVQPLSLSGVKNTNVEIFDDYGILGDTSTLRQSLEDFKSETGIVPTVVVIENKEWVDQGYQLEQYAYNWYVYHYDDEKHWVIMYSEEIGSNDTFGNWYWEGMQGDDTDYIVTEDVANKFTDSLHNYLIAGSRYTKSEAIAQAFDDLHGTLIGPKKNTEGFVEGILHFIIGAVIMLVVIVLRVKNKAEIKGFKEIKGVKIENNAPLEDTCAYCGCAYAIGTVYTCPHCGAAIPAHNPINNG